MIAEVNKNVVKSSGNILEQVVGPGGGETIYPPPRWHFDSRRIYVRPRTGPHIPGVRPAAGSQVSVPTAGLGQTDGRIAVSLNARYGGGIKSCHLP